MVFDGVLGYPSLLLYVVELFAHSLVLRIDVTLLVHLVLDLAQLLLLFGLFDLILLFDVADLLLDIVAVKGKVLLLLKFMLFLLLPFLIADFDFLSQPSITGKELIIFSDLRMLLFQNSPDIELPIADLAYAALKLLRSLRDLRELSALGEACLADG